jgi:hypothetical protein
LLVKAHPRREIKKILTTRPAKSAKKVHPNKEAEKVSLLA